MGRGKQNKLWFVDVDELQSIASMSKTWTDILTHYGFINNGACCAVIKRIFSERGIESGHILNGKNNSEVTRLANARRIERRDSYIKRWLSGEESGLVGNKISRLIRPWLIETRGEKCEKCGWNERHLVTGSVPIELHHEDGDYRNNRPENLKLLCPNCHSLTPTFRNLNAGNGRSYRCLRSSTVER